MSTSAADAGASHSPQEKCPKCGANLQRPYYCELCRQPLSLEDYGYTVQAGKRGWTITAPDGSSDTYTSPGTGTAKRLSERFSVPLELVRSSLAAANVSNEQKSAAEEEETVTRYLATVRTAQFIADTVWDGAQAPRYVVKWFGEDGFKTQTTIDLNEIDDKGRRIIYRPPYTEQLIKGSVTVPAEPDPCTLSELVDEVISFALSLYDPGTPEKRDMVKLLCLITISSWFLEHLKPHLEIPVAGVGVFAPILPIRGPRQSGKNRLAQALRFLSFRPFFALSTEKIPSLFRPLDLWQGTLILDECDVEKTELTAALTQFLNSRATGTPIPRADDEQGKVFLSFGITIVTQRQQFDDDATESRAIPFQSRKTKMKLPTVETDEFIRKGLELQNKLLYQRLTLFEKFDIDKTQWHVKASDSRLNAALLPVMALSIFEPSIGGIIDGCVKSIEEEKKRVKANSVDGLIVNYLWDKIDAGEFRRLNLYIYLTNQRIIEVRGSRSIAEAGGSRKRQQSLAGDEETRTIVEPVTASIMKEALTFSPKTIRKVLGSLGLIPKDAPPKIWFGSNNGAERREDGGGSNQIRGKTYNAIILDPEILEDHLREFVVGYEADQLYERLGLPKADLPVLPDLPPSTVTQPVNKQTSEPCVSPPPAQMQVEEVEDVEGDTSPWVSRAAGSLPVLPDLPVNMVSPPAESQGPSLQERLDSALRTLVRLQGESGGEAVDKASWWKVTGLRPDEFDQLVKILERDGRAFSLSPQKWRPSL